MTTSDSIRGKGSSVDKKRYMPGLDGLRAISVLAVIAYHLNLSWAPGGFLGVGVFFVLSGYLITDQLMAHWQDTARLDLKDFWIRRFRRLMPGLFFMLGILSLYLFLYNRSMLSSLQGDFLSVVLYFNNWWLIFHQVSYFESFGPPSPIGHLWSLAIEEQFYLLWPLILVLLLRFAPQRSKLVLFTIIGAAASVVAMALIYNVGTDPSRVYYGTDTRAFALLIGAALAMVWPSRSLKKQIPRNPRIILDLAGAVGLLAIILIMWKTNEYNASLYLGGLASFSIITAVVTAVLAHPASLTGRVMGCKPLRWIGVRSYSLYLWHFPVIILTSPAVDTGGPNVGRLVIQLIITTILAAASYKYIEEPIRRGSFTLRLESINIPTPLMLRCTSVMVIVSLLLFVCTGPSHMSKETYANAPGVVKGIRIDPPTPVENPPADSQEPEVNTPDEKPPEVNSPDVGSEVKTNALITAIGDSVILGAEPYLKKIFPGIVIDGELGRQMNQARDVVNRLKAEGKLGDCVIIELGSNGPFKPEEFHTLLTSLGDVQQIIIVNTRVPKRWQDTVNSDLANAAAEFPQATLVDWYDASQGNDAYFYGDGVHLSPQGAECYAALISDAVKITTGL
jgi:peptidoglycan/LPS O-acetylase OafA/YrhL